MNVHELINSFESHFREYYQLLNKLNEGNLSYIPNNSSWNLRDLLEMLADLEDEIIDYRLKKILEEEHPYLPQIRMERIRRNRIYRNFPLSRLVHHILQQRRSFLQLLYSLPPEKWERTGVHELEGHITFKEFVRRMIEKDKEILNQLHQALAPQHIK